MEPRVIATILTMALVTYIPRALPVLLLSRRTLPEPVLQWLTLLPPAILSALVANEVLLREGRLDVGWQNPVLVPAVVTGLVAWRTKSLGWTVVAGLAAAALYKAVFA